MKYSARFLMWAWLGVAACATLLATIAAAHGRWDIWTINAVILVMCGVGMFVCQKIMRRGADT